VRRRRQAVPHWRGGDTVEGREGGEVLGALGSCGGPLRILIYVQLRAGKRANFPKHSEHGSLWISPCLRSAWFSLCGPSCDAPLALLDDACSGMGEEMMRAARRYLRDRGRVGPEQTIVVVTHWEEEMPWGTWEGVMRFRLDGVVGRVGSWSNVR